ELSHDPGKSVQLALDAVTLVPTTAAESALRVALAQSAVRLILHAGNAQVVDIDISPDGTRIAAAGFDGAARVWNAVTGQLVHKFLAPGPANTVAFSRTGSKLLVAGNRGAEIFDVRTGARVSVLSSAAGILNAELGRDDRVVTGSDSLAATVW